MLKTGGHFQSYNLVDPVTLHHTSFPSTHGTFSRTYHVPGHKMILNKCEKPKFTGSMISDHNGIQLDINNRKTDESPKYFKIAQHASE